jgi:hypothetical protein
MVECVHDENRFRLTDEKWITLCCEFNLSDSWQQRSWASMFQEPIDWESVEDLHRFYLEVACSYYPDGVRSESPVRRLKDLSNFLRSTEKMLRRFSQLHLDVDLSRALTRDMKAKLPESSFANYKWAWPIDEEPRDICHDLIKHIEVIRDSTKREIDRRANKRRRSVRKPAQNFLLIELLEYWKNTLLLPVERANPTCIGSSPKGLWNMPPGGGSLGIANFLIRVPEVVFDVTISPDVADHAIREFLKEKKQEYADFGDDD